MTHQNHQPVLAERVLEVLQPKIGQSYLDGTAGYGGHASLVADMIGPTGRLVLVDRDDNAVQALSYRFGERAIVLHASYLEAAEELAGRGERFDLILLDLGVSSPQLDNAERGFSFKADAPLDMRMDQRERLTAAMVVNTYPQPRLEQILREYGEEPRARAVARAIIAARPLVTTSDLARVVRPAAVSSKTIDAATRTFQAIRIEVNGELEQLRQALPVLESLLSPHGRLAVISFHSLEDRIVKRFFDAQSRDCICPPKQPVCTCDHRASLGKLTPKPITATPTEIATNPRARSAKLRAAENLNQNQKEGLDVHQSRRQVTPRQHQSTR